MTQSITDGEAARKVGRYDKAVRTFAFASAGSNCTAKAMRREFEALREFQISRHLVHRFYAAMHLDLTAYRGFAALDPSFAGTNSTRLDELAEKSAELAALRASDRVAQRQGLPSPEITVAPGPSSKLQYAAIIARRAEACADFTSARIVLEQAVSAGNTSAETEGLLAQALWRTGNRIEAMRRFNTSLLMLPERQATQYVLLHAEYRGRRIVVYQGSYYALRKWEEAYVEERNEQITLMHHRSPPKLRKWLRQHLPSTMIEWLRGLMVRLPLVEALRFEDLPHAGDLATLLDLIDAENRQNKGD